MVQFLEREDRPHGVTQAGAGKYQFVSALVAIGALLGVKLVRGYSEHVIALNADSVEHRFIMFRGLGFRRGMSVILCGHDGILPCSARIPHRAVRVIRGIQEILFRIFYVFSGRILQA
jgi:hypothetical protein